MIKNFKQFINENAAAQPAAQSPVQSPKLGERYTAIWVNPENPDERMGTGEVVLTVKQETESPQYLIASITTGGNELYSANQDGVYSHPDYKWSLKVTKKL